MLILPGGHAAGVDRPPLARRERIMIAGALALLAAVAVAVVVSLTVADKRSGHGCVSVALAYSTGGAQIYRCGASARALCESAGQPGGPTGQPARQLATECRRAGLPAG